MKVKKLEEIVLYVGAGCAALALLLTFLAPVFAGEGLAYSGFAVFGVGFVTLFSFNFANPVVMLLFFLFLISLICLGLWCWQLIRNKGAGFTKFLDVFSIALCYASLAACTLYAFVNFGMLNLVGPDYREMELPFGRKE